MMSEQEALKRFQLGWVRLKNEIDGLKDKLTAANAKIEELTKELDFYKSRHQEAHSALNEATIVNGVADANAGLRTRIMWLTKDRDTALADNARLVEAIKANHKWHQDNDEFGGYDDSKMCDINMDALSKPSTTKRK